MKGTAMLTYAEMQAKKLEDKAQLQEDVNSNPTSKALMGQLVMKLFDARTSTHVQHLQTESFAAHSALGGFYDGIVGLADGIVESWQGCYGEILQYPNPSAIQTDPLSTLTELRSWIEANRYLACDESEIQNEIDAVLNLINGTVYKLKFLK